MEEVSTEFLGRCDRCGKKLVKKIALHNGKYLGEECVRVLEGRVRLRIKGDGLIQVRICKETFKVYWQNEVFDKCCPDSCSCFACSFMTQKVCPAEALVNSLRKN